MTNSLAEDIVSRGQELADNLNTMGVSDADVEDGLKTLVGKVLDISTSKIRTVLTLNTPMLVYTDEFDVTGTLTDEENNPIENATIILVWNDGTEHIASETTDENGEVTFHSTDPASVISYSFQLIFAGDSVYSGSSSSTVTVSPNKETAVVVVNCPSTTTTSSVTVSGTLKDNDNTPMSGTTIFVKINGSTSSTNNITVGSDGTFSKTISGLSEGSNSVIFSTTGSITHTAVSQTCTVIKTSFDGIDLTSDKDILSKADNEYATLTAQLTSSGSPISIEGETVSFEVRKVSDDSLVETLTDDTNSSGIATVSYYGKGVGDIYIKAECNLLIQTYDVYDCLEAYDGSSVTGLIVDSGVSCTSNGSYITISKNTSGEKYVYLRKQLAPSDDFSYEIEIAENGVGLHLSLNYNNATWYGGVDTTPRAFANTGSTQYLNISTVKGGVYKFQRKNGVNTAYWNDEVIATNSNTPSNSFKVGFYTNNGRTQYVKNIMLKPL